MREDEITEERRYYRHGDSKVAHIVKDTFFRGLSGSLSGRSWEYHHINTYCRGIFNFGEEGSDKNTWGSKEDVLVEGVSLCETCDKAFEEAKRKGILNPTKPGYTFAKGMELLREIIKDKEKES